MAGLEDARKEGHMQLTLVYHKVLADCRDGVQEVAGEASVLIRVLSCDIGHNGSHAQLLRDGVHARRAGTQQTQLTRRGTGGSSLGGGYFG